MNEARNESGLRDAWVEIRLDHMKYNLTQIRRHIGPNRNIMAILKADAYGHGALTSARVMHRMGVEEFGVATVAEGLQLRNAGFSEPITVLGACPETAVDSIVEQNLSPLLCSVPMASALSKTASERNKTVRTFLAIDTGMTRLGLNPHDSSFIQDVKRLLSFPSMQIRGLFTHFATADETDLTFLHHQTHVMDQTLHRLSLDGIHFPECCMANSAAIMIAPETWHTMVRPGIILYGCYPSAQMNRSAFPLRPVMRFRARIVHLHQVPAGTTVGYGRHFTARSPSRIATIPIGYADGYSRSLSKSGYVLIHGKKAPIAGAICMDQCMVDVTDIPEAKTGDPVTLMGQDGSQKITAEDLAAQCHTINYEILCRFGQRLEKIYIEHEIEP